MKRNTISCYKTLITILTCVIPLASCKKLVEVEAPATSINADVVFTSDGTALAVLTGIYTKMSQSGISSGMTSISQYAALTSDELVLFSGVQDLSLTQIYSNEISPDNPVTGSIWASAYNFIYTANIILEKAPVGNLSEHVKRQVLGEAYFIRAFNYFYLVNLFGDVPLALTSNYKTNQNLPRKAKPLIYQQIIDDLLQAKTLLSDSYLDKNGQKTVERVSPNKFAASALLARTYLFTGQYANAIEESTYVIDKNDTYELVAVDQVFLKNNKEAIWQIQSVDNVVTNTSEAQRFILIPNGPDPYGHPVYLSASIYEDFEPEDKRFSFWMESIMVDGVNYTYPAKYKEYNLFFPVVEYSVVLRLAEQFLIRSEAYTRLGNFTMAQNDLNILRLRAGLTQLSSSNEQSLINSIIVERKHELFTEWGHRFLDLKRTEMAFTVLPETKENWEDHDALFPIPQGDIDRNPGLRGGQNPGF